MEESDPFEITESPYPLPPGIEGADPSQRMRDDIHLINRLREMLRTQRKDSRAEMRAVLLKLLQVADSLERILETLPDPQNPAEIRQWNSIRVTRKQLDEVFRLQRVAPIELRNKPADPYLCEVESYVVNPDLPDETVVAEIMRGYHWGDEPEPLRSAIVKVSRVKELG
jgi:molecular chaperone GrpE (heat shock protein)